MHKKEFEEIGYHFTRGAFKYLAAIGFIVFVVLIIWGYARKPDSSDIGRFERSGMRIHTDQMTGVQYLSVAGGGITPRLDANGKLMVRHGQKKAVDYGRID